MGPILAGLAALSPWAKVAGAGMGLLGLLRNRRQNRQQNNQDTPNIPEHQFTGRAPVFPGAGYQPGIDGEFNYFPSYKKGGLVKYAEGGLASIAPPQMQRQQPQGGGDDENLIRMAVAAISGQIPNPEQILQIFVSRFGQEALVDLISKVKGGGMVEGQGDGMSDQVPAMQGQQPARLSDGEFVVPADVVSGIGNGSTQAGAGQLQEMLARVRKERGGSAEQPPAIDPSKLMPV